MNIRLPLVTIVFLLAQLVVSSNAVYANELQQLFTSAQQRAQIDHERWQSKQTVVQKSGDLAPVEWHRQLFFEALLKTEKGHSVWLNGRMLDRKETLQGIVIDPHQIRSGQLLLQTPKGMRRLSLGQVYWIEQDKVLESYEKP